MRIVISSAYKIGGETGTARVSETLIKYLSARNNVLYFCLGQRLSLKKRAKNLKILTVPSVEMKGFSIPLITPTVLKKVNKILSEFNPDIIHSQNIDPLGNIAQKFAGKNNIPFLLTFHFLPHEGLGYVFPFIKKIAPLQFLNRSIFVPYVKSIIAKADLVIALNSAINNSIKKIGTGVKIRQLNNGLDLESLTKIKRKIPGNIIKFIFLGSYLPRKNQLFLVETFKYLPLNYKLYLYGNFASGGNYLAKIKNKVQKENIENIFVNDFVKGDKVVEAYSSANYFVSASTKEVQSLVIIEALASGLPVIALKNETTSEIVENTFGLVLPLKTSSKIFADNLLKFVKNTNRKYLPISHMGRKRIERFSIKNTVLDLEKIYEEEIKMKSRN